jgi:hypothetical protein
VNVTDANIHVVSNEAGEPTAIIVPIALWKGITSARETAYLLRSGTMHQRLLDDLKRNTAMLYEEAVAILEL